MIEVLGYVAAILTSCIFVPQVIRSIQTKSTKDISTLSFVVAIVAAIAWLIYGFSTGAGPLLLVNGISLALSSTQLVLKYKYEEMSSLDK